MKHEAILQHTEARTLDGVRANGFATALTGQAVALNGSRPTKSLLFSSALAATQPGGARSLSLPHLRNPVLSANQSTPPGVASVHPSVFSRINGAKMFRPATTARVATVVNVPPSGLVKGLVNKAMNLSQTPGDPHVAIPLRIAGARPNPAFAVHNEPRIEAKQIIMREHARSIHKAGFTASAFRLQSHFAGGC